MRRHVLAAMLAASLGGWTGAAIAAPDCPQAHQGAAGEGLMRWPTAGTEQASGRRFDRISFSTDNPLLGPAVAGCGVAWSGTPQGTRLQLAYAEASRRPTPFPGDHAPRSRAGSVGMTAIDSGDTRWHVEAAFRHSESPDYANAVGGVASRLSFAGGRVRLLSDAAVAPPGAGLTGGNALRNRVELAGRLAEVDLDAHVAAALTEAGFHADGPDADRTRAEGGFRLGAGRASLTYARKVKRQEFGAAAADSRRRWVSDRVDAGLKLWPERAELPDRVSIGARRASTVARPASAGGATAWGSLHAVDGSLLWQGETWRTRLTVKTSERTTADAAGISESSRSEAGATARLDLGSWGIGLRAGGASEVTDGESRISDARLGLSLEWGEAADIAVAVTADAHRTDAEGTAVSRGDGLRVGFSLDPTGRLAGFVPNRSLRTALSYQGDLRTGDDGVRDHALKASVSLGF